MTSPHGDTLQKTYMNGWSTTGATTTTIHCMDSFDGKACYCIEPGITRNVGDTYTKYDENFWDNYPSSLNSTIEPDDIKLLLGRIMQYGYQGNISTSWKSQNSDDADKMAHALATQILVWEAVIGERCIINHVSPGSYDAVKSVVNVNHPLYSRVCSYYDSIVASVQSHTKLPSFMAKSSAKAQNIELEWNGSEYTATLTDTNDVVSKYLFKSDVSGISFSVSGNKLTITATEAPTDAVTITASKSNTRSGVIVWSDGQHRSGGVQDTVTYSATVSDPVKAYLNIKVSYGEAKIVKHSEDGKIAGVKFNISGNGIDQTVSTELDGTISIPNLAPGDYVVSEVAEERYEPQMPQTVTVLSGRTATVTFSNTLKCGDLEVTKSSEDGLVKGVKFHLFGTSLSGLAVDEYAVTDAYGVAYFDDVLISGTTPYTLEEVDTAIRYVVPDDQTAPILWNDVTERSFTNILKKFRVEVVKSDAETGTAQGDTSLTGAKYGLYKGSALQATYTTDADGSFISDYFVCDTDWTLREISPSEGYLINKTVYTIPADAENFKVELNPISMDVNEQVIKGNICDALIYATRRQDTEILTDHGTLHEASDSDEFFSELKFDLDTALKHAKESASPSIREGIAALMLLPQDYSSIEVGEKLHMSPNTVRAMASKARKYLRSYPKISLLKEGYAT